MEIYMLLRDFAAEPARMEKWLGAGERVLLNEYAPKHLRLRQANRLGIDVKDLAETNDYRTHSRDLHVSPKQDRWFQRGLRIGPSNREIDAFNTYLCFWEMVEHAESIAVVVRELWYSFARGKQIGLGLDKRLPRMAAGHEVIEKLKEKFEEYFSQISEEVDEAEVYMPPTLVKT